MLSFYVSLIALITFWLQAGFATLDNYTGCVTFLVISAIFAAWSIYQGIYDCKTAGDNVKKCAAGQAAQWIGTIIFLGLIASWILYSTPIKFAQ